MSIGNEANATAVKEGFSSFDRNVILVFISIIDRCIF
jgi:hypothetical protein